MDKIKVLIVDDHTVLRDSVRAFVGLYDDIEIVGEASEGKEAVDKAQELKPNVIVMDVLMPGMDGIEATRRIVRLNPKVRVLILTQYDDRDHIILAIKAGASGYVPKRASGSELISAIRAVQRGEPFLYPSATSALIKDYLHRIDEEPYDGLTGREREILKLIAEGHTSRQIAACLLISLKTVLSHRCKMMKKLDLHNCTELIKYAICKGLITMDT